ncbi:MAG: Tissue inhibitor of metalloproteinase, partial [Solirubrobacteraceae bacterium]|nr:Tissue inhibitor of metalloproteinase [Solirubrobacteraceae bacterium]
MTSPALSLVRAGSRIGRRRACWLLAPVLAGTVAALGAELAMACSCAPVPVRESLHAADAAFVGVVTARRVMPSGPPGTFSSGDPAEVDFRVERAYKGALGEQVTVHTVASGATCGIEAQVGERVGLFLQRRADGGWTS